MEYQFDPNAVEDNGYDGTPLPVGDYTVIGEACEAKQTKANNGSWFFEFTFVVIDGPHKDRKIWHRFNMQNASEICTQIGNREYKRLHVALAMGPTGGPEELLHKPLVVQVGLEKGTTDKVEIKKFKSVDGQVAQQASTPPPVQQQSAPVSQPATAGQTPASAGGVVQDASSKMPWE